jgi:hypothetical protein
MTATIGGLNDIVIHGENRLAVQTGNAPGIVGITT